MQQFLLWGALLLGASSSLSCTQKQPTVSVSPEAQASSQEQEAQGQKAFLQQFYTRLFTLEESDASAIPTFLSEHCTRACLQFLQQQDRAILEHYDGYEQGTGSLYFRIGGQDPNFATQLTSLRIEADTLPAQYKVTMSDRDTFTSTLTLVKSGDSYKIDKVHNPHWDDHEQPKAQQ